MAILDVPLSSSAPNEPTKRATSQMEDPQLSTSPTNDLPVLSKHEWQQIASYAVLLANGNSVEKRPNSTARLPRKATVVFVATLPVATPANCIVSSKGVPFWVMTSHHVRARDALHVPYPVASRSCEDGR